MTTQDSAVVLEPAAQAFVEARAKPPFLFDMPIEQGRKTVDQAQDGDFTAPAGAEWVFGDMSAAVTIMRKQRGGPRLAGQLLYYPVTDASFDKSRSLRCVLPPTTSGTPSGPGDQW